MVSEFPAVRVRTELAGRMNTDEANTNTSDHSADHSGQPQPQTQTQPRPTTRERIITQARRWAPILYTVFRIVWQITTDDDLHHH